MATLATEKARVYEANHAELVNELPMIDNDIIYEGAAVGQSAATGTFRPLAEGDDFAGFAEATANNTISGHAASFTNVRVKQRGRIVLSVTGASAVTDVGKSVYASDDDTFTLTATGTKIGTVARWKVSTTCVVDFRATNINEPYQITFVSPTTAAATDRVIFLATRPCRILAASEVHKTAAGEACVVNLTKDTGTDAPGAGTVILTNTTNTGFNLEATAETVQLGTFATTAGLLTLAAGNRISLKFGGSIGTTAGVAIGLTIINL